MNSRIVFAATLLALAAGKHVYVEKPISHNIREGLHALAALVRYRQSDRARDVAADCIEAINRYWDPQGGWDRRHLEDELGLKLVEIDGPFITGLARAIGPAIAGLLVAQIGVAAVFALNTATFLFYAVVVAFHLRVVFGEEPWLALTHGEAWHRYRAAVPRWFGRARGQA